MNASEYVFKKGEKWVFREPGYTKYSGWLRDGKYEAIEHTPHQDFEYETEREAIGHAVWYLKPDRVWFPPPPA